MRKFSLLLLLAGIGAQAQIPDGYYNTATGTGYTLKSQLHDIIDNHSNQGYGALWDFYSSYELDSYYENDGTILDIYSENPTGTDPYNFTKISDQCGNYSGEGDCYNREHSFPRSWFGGDVEPMNSDVHHIFASDGRVNAIRGSFPYGVVSSVSTTSQNGSKLGSGTSAQGYTGTVFEPIDEFKGDIARAYFYMATRYEDVISSWQNNSSSSDAVLNGSSDQVYEDWVVNLMLNWHLNDPVSQKEIDRNDNAYDNHQGNRNPFIDHPEWVECIWNNDCTGGSGASLTTSAPEGGFSFGNVAAGSSSMSQSYQVSGTDLEGDVSVSVSSPFELSLNNTSWNTSLTITQSNAESGSNNTVYVRFSPTVENGNSFNQSISHSSTNATSINVSVSGTERTVSIADVRDAINGTNGQEFTIEGIVTTPDYGGSHGQYFVQDETGGINIFHSGNQGLVSRGDLVQITGTRTVFNEIIELEPSSVTIQGSGQNLPSPVTIEESDLSVGSINEGSLIRISAVTLDNVGEWPTSGGGSGANVNATVGTTGFIIRIDDSSFYYGSSAPSGELIVSGILSQFDGVLQIFPFVDGDVEEAANLNPELTVSPSTVAFGDVVENENSQTEVLSLNASDLSSDISISTSGDFEFSESESGTYTKSLTISAGNGTITNKSIYVRFSPIQLGAQTATITFQSGDEIATSNLSGTGISPPSPQIEITTTGFNSDFGIVVQGEISSVNSYSISGEHLIESITVISPEHFEISLSETGGFDDRLSLSQSAGVVNPTIIYVRFSPGEAGNLSGDITHSSSGESETLSVQGVGALIARAKKSSLIRIYPNPVADLLWVDGLTQNSVIEVLDVFGRSMEVGRNNNNLDVTQLDSGIYFLQIVEDQISTTVRFLVR